MLDYKFPFHEEYYCFQEGYMFLFRYILIFILLATLSGCHVTKYHNSAFDISPQSLISVIRKKISDQGWYEKGSGPRKIIAAYNEPWHHEYQMVFKVFKHRDGRSSYEAELFSHTDISPIWAWAVIYWPAWNGKAKAKVKGAKLIAAINKGDDVVIEKYPRETPITPEVTIERKKFALYVRNSMMEV